MKLCLRCNQYFEDNVEQCPTDAIMLESVGKDPLIGALINNRYLVESVIGKGSSGIVYRATRLGRGEMVVAIKVLHSFIGAAGSALDRFLREAQAASRLRNPHIITIWESGVTEDGQPYFVMDYLEGMTLGRLIREKGQIEPKRVLSIMRQTCEALGEAHRLGITHRDLKPENIVLQVTGQEDDYVKLLDFGIADSPQHAMLAYKLEKPRTVSGSPAYMSPEQCQGFDLDGRSDIYSLAIVVFEMLTGTRPFRQSEDVNVMVLHVSEAPMALAEARPDLNFPAAIEHVIGRALSKQPTQRQPTIQDFFADLENAWQLLDQQPVTTNANNKAATSLHKLQEVATSIGNAVQKSGNTSGTVDTEVARANPYASNQPSVLGPPPARMSSTHNKLEAQNPAEKLTPDQGTQPVDKETATGTSTVQRLLKAVHNAKIFSKTKDKLPALPDPSLAKSSSVPNSAPSSALSKMASLSGATAGAAASGSIAAEPAGLPSSDAGSLEGETADMTKIISQADPVSPVVESSALDIDKDKLFYVRQQHKNTISRLEGWKKAEKTRAAMVVTTRAKAAAIKGEKVPKPINFLNFLITLTTLLCLGASLYIIGAALRTPIPQPISLQYLARLGKYDRIKAILETKELTGPLTAEERDELGSAYINLAKSHIVNRQIDQALLLLARIDPESSSAAQGKKLRERLIKLAKGKSK